MITITDNIDWGHHISEMSSKATKTLGFLCSDLAFASKSTKEVEDKHLVGPKLQYAAPIWSLYLKCQINQIEKIQGTVAQVLKFRYLVLRDLLSIPSKIFVK